MLEIDFSEQSKKILVIGGLFKDIELKGKDHQTNFDSRIGGAAYNVALVLSELGYMVYFGTVYPDNYYERLYKPNLKIFPLIYPSEKGFFLYRGKDILGVKRPTIIKDLFDLKSIFIKENFLAFFTTLELGSNIVNELSYINSKWKFLDPSPWFEGDKIETYQQFDFIFPNSMEYDKISKLPFEKSIIKKGVEGISYKDNFFENKNIGIDKFGNGDLFDAIFISEIISGRNVQKSIETAMEVAADFSVSDLSYESFVKKSKGKRKWSISES